MTILIGALVVLGIISLLYYGIVISYAGIQCSFAWIWLLLGIVCVILILSITYIIKNEIYVAKALRIIGITIIAIGLGVFIFIEGTIVLQANQKAEDNMDYLIVLGAQVRGTKITKVLQKRLDIATEYLNDNPTTLVIVSGGQGTGEDISEAEAMRLYLLEQGIAEKRIIKEDKSTNTNENIRFSKNIINDEDATIAVVTNGFHVYRAVAIAKKQGLKKVQGLSAPSDKILLINYYVREVFGVIKDKFVGNL